MALRSIFQNNLHGIPIIANIFRLLRCCLPDMQSGIADNRGKVTPLNGMCLL
jgi:hypothetical protein